VLAWAARWSADAVARARSDDDPLSPMEALIALDDALTAVTGLADHGTELLGRAGAGPSVAAYLGDVTARLAGFADRIEQARKELTALRAAEEDLRAREAEHERLRREVAELRRRERLVDALAALAGQHELITARLAVLRAATGDPGPALQRDASELLRLTRRELSTLEAPARDVLHEAARAQAELAEQEARVTEGRDMLRLAVERQERLRVEHDQQVAALAAQAEADREIAEALAALAPGAPARLPADTLATTRDLLDQVRRQLHSVDEALRQALDAGQPALAAARAALDWSDPR
jgi:hypothetical protein